LKKSAIILIAVLCLFIIGCKSEPEVKSNAPLEEKAENTAEEKTTNRFASDEKEELKNIQFISINMDVPATWEKSTVSYIDLLYFDTDYGNMEIDYIYTGQYKTGFKEYMSLQYENGDLDEFYEITIDGHEAYYTEIKSKGDGSLDTIRVFLPYDNLIYGISYGGQDILTNKEVVERYNEFLESITLEKLYSGPDIEYFSYTYGHRLEESVPAITFEIPAEFIYHKFNEWPERPTSEHVFIDSTQQIYLSVVYEPNTEGFVPTKQDLYKFFPINADYYLDEVFVAGEVHTLKFYDGAGHITLEFLSDKGEEFYGHDYWVYFDDYSYKFYLTGPLDAYKQINEMMMNILNTIEHN